MRNAVRRTRFKFFIVLILFSGCAEKKEKSPIIVRIGNQTLTVADLQSSLPKETKATMSRDDIREYVRSWMNNQILYQEGMRKGYGNDPDILRRVENYRMLLIGSAYIDKHLGEEITFADTVVQNYYEANGDDFTRKDDEVYLYHILMPTKKQADSVYNLIRYSRQPFDSMAQKIASLQQLKKEEWDLGYVSQGMLLDKLYRAVRKRRVGLPTRAIETDFGFHLLQVRDRKRKGTQRELDDVYDEILSRLRHINRNERYRQHLSLLKNGATIETNFQLIDSMPLDSLLYKTNFTTQSE